jgi:hypothetical protein
VRDERDVKWSAHPTRRKLARWGCDLPALLL